LLPAFIAVSFYFRNQAAENVVSQKGSLARIPLAIFPP
jgi:hypothetical protein